MKDDGLLLLGFSDVIICCLFAPPTCQTACCEAVGRETVEVEGAAGDDVCVCV
jgi:hypothetical protein